MIVLPSGPQLTFHKHTRPGLTSSRTARDNCHFWRMAARYTVAGTTGLRIACSKILPTAAVYSSARPLTLAGMDSAEQPSPKDAILIAAAVLIPADGGHPFSSIWIIKVFPA